MTVEPYWAPLFAKLAQKKSIDDFITNVGAGKCCAECWSLLCRRMPRARRLKGTSLAPQLFFLAGGGAAAPVAAGAAAGGAAEEAPKEEAKKEESEEEDADMGFSLFD